MTFWVAVYIAFMSLGMFIFTVAAQLCMTGQQKEILGSVIEVKYLLIGIGAIIVAVTV